LFLLQYLHIIITIIIIIIELTERRGDRWLLVGRTRSQRAHRVEVRVSYFHFEVTTSYSNTMRVVTATLPSVACMTARENKREFKDMGSEEAFIQPEGQFASETSTGRPHILLLLQPNSVFFTSMEGGGRPQNCFITT